MLTYDMFDKLNRQLLVILLQTYAVTFNMAYSLINGYWKHLEEFDAGGTAQAHLDASFALQEGIFGENWAFLTDFPVGTFTDVAFNTAWRATFDV